MLRLLSLHFLSFLIQCSLISIQHTSLTPSIIYTSLLLIFPSSIFLQKCVSIFLIISHVYLISNMCMCAKLLQSCPTLCDPMDCSPQGFSRNPGILLSRILEWVARPSSRGSSQARDRTHISYVSFIGRQVLLPLAPPGKPCISHRGSQYQYLFNHLVVSDSLWPHGLQHSRPPCPSPSPRACSNSCSLSQWCHPAILNSVMPFSSCLQSFPASASLLMSWLFASGGQSIGASELVPPMNIQDRFPLGLTGWIFLQSKGLSRVFSNTTVQKHQFFGTQSSL